MKRYLLLLRSSDFVKNNNVWTTSYINLYNNNSYSNYSYVRSSGGSNLIGDRTYTGIEVTSPSYGAEDATPISDNVLYVTDAGEVVYDSATPSILRFLDTSSKIDIINYRHIFVNLPGQHTPGFSIQFYESDESTGPWMKTVYGSDNGTVLASNVKPYIRIELTLDDQNIDLDSVGLVFYLEVAIHDIVPENISQSARQIIERFPSWTKIYEDSAYGSTPNLDVPKSTGGKLINALAGVHLDDLQRRVDLTSINSYINSADENMTAWVYATYSVQPNVIKVEGDSVTLARVSNFSDLINLRPTDYAYYIDNVTRQLVTNRSFNLLKINDLEAKQEAIGVYNFFDELGARVGVPRLYLESNANFKKRILDASQNLSGVTKRGLQLALRRELDIWRAYGSTPDSSFIGATPEIIEIEDMQGSTPYFSEYGHPQKVFKDLIEDINIKYPSNIGYVNWGEGIWDYGGVIGQGISRIPAVYDKLTDISTPYYRPGIGDFDDAKLSFEYEDAATINFSGKVKIEGTQLSDYRDLYLPISVPHNISIGYTRDTIEAPTSGPFFTYIALIDQYGEAATPAAFYSNFSADEYSELAHVNIYPEGHSASPEYNILEVFDHDGYTSESLVFRNQENGEIYVSTGSTPEFNRIFFEDISEIIVRKNELWDPVSLSYAYSLNNNHKISFSLDNPNWISDGVLLFNSSEFELEDLDILVGSNIYSTTPNNYTSENIRREITLNANNNLSEYDISAIDIQVMDQIEAILLPSGATPHSIYLDVVKDPIEDSYGGYSLDPLTGERYFIPSSPNIILNISAIQDYWTQLGPDILGESAGDFFGGWVSLSSDGLTLAAGGRYNDNVNGVNSGHVRVYKYSSGFWTQLGSDIYGESLGDLFGFKLSLSSSGSRLAIGSYLNDNINGVDSGSVRVFDWNGTDWVQIGNDIDGEGEYDYSGFSVSLSGNGLRLGIGAIYNNGVNSVDSGHVRIYEWTGTDWVQIGDDIDGEGLFDQFGWSVSLSSDGSRAAIGALVADDVPFSNSGQVKVFEWSGSGWIQIGNDINGEAPDDEFGISVSLSSNGQRLAVGSIYNDNINGVDSGSVRVFDWNGTDWVQIGNDIDGQASGDQFGSIVSLSGNGSYLAVSSSSSPGYVVVYKLENSNWIQFGEYITSDAVGSRSNSISYDGSILAVGIQMDDSNGNASGKVQAYTTKPSYVQSFDSATLNYNNDYSISIKSSNGDLYPVKARVLESFSAETTPNLYSGYIDIFENAYRSDEEPFNSYYNNDKLVGSYSLGLDSFNLSEDSFRVIDKISLITNNDSVIQYTDDLVSLKDNLQAALLNGDQVNFNLYAELDPYAERDYKSSIHTGLFSIDNTDYYIYSEPVTDTFENSKDFELTLTSVPRGGHPVIVKVGQDYYRNIFFQDYATPNLHSFYNKEIITGNKYNLIHLSYENVHVNYVKDLFLGKDIFTDIEVEGYSLEPFNSATPMVVDREYEVEYVVNNSFYIDKDFYNSNSDSYEAKLYLSSTPDIAQDYLVTYEGSLNSNDHFIDLRIDSIENPLDEGFVYIDNREVPFSQADIHLSPQSISDNPNDLMYLTIISKDSYSNLKANQNFTISGQEISATPSSLTTDKNGVGKSLIRYYKSPWIELGYPESLSEISSTYSNNIGDGPNGIINDLVKYPNGKTLLVGNFTTWDNVYCGRAALIGVDGELDENFVQNCGLGANGIIYSATMLPSGKIILAGLFSQWDTNTGIGNIVVIDQDGNLDSSLTSQFGTGSNGQINSVEIFNQSIYIGGSFDEWDSSSVGNIAVLNIDGSFNNEINSNIGLGSNSNISSIRYAGPDNIIACGDFTLWDQVSVGRIVSISEDGTLNSLFMNNIGEASNSSINACLVASGDLFLIGSFTTWNEISVAKIVKIDKNGVFNSEFNSNISDGPDSEILTGFINSKNDIILGGSFSSWDGVSVGRIVKISYQGILDTKFLIESIPGFNGTVQSLFDLEIGYFFASGSFTTFNGQAIPGVALSVGSIYVPENFLKIESNNGYSATVNYTMQAQLDFIVSVKAVPARFHYTSNGDVYVNIVGQVYWRDKPLEAEIDLDWYVANTLYDLFATPDHKYYGNITTNSDGSFEINDVILADPQSDPGASFAVIEFSNPNSVRSLIQSLGEVLTNNLITIGGDIVYWHETYDPVQYADEDTVINSVFRHMKYEDSDLYSTPNFVYSHSDSEIIRYNNSSYNWKPPRWVPIPRYEQYQMGILGSTPNLISDYSQIHPDSSEQ